MPTDKARKAATRAAQLPGETYTAALRRLASDTTPAAGTAAVEWRESGGGLGSTEFEATLAGRTVTVSFFGDHKTPWPGYWHGLLEDLDEDAGNGAELFADGRYRLSSQPDDAQLDTALAVIGDQLLAVLATPGPATEEQLRSFYDDSHGDPLTPADLEADDAQLVFFSWNDHEGPDRRQWGVSSIEVRPEGGGWPFRVWASDLTDVGEIRWTGEKWTLTDGTPAHLYAL